MFDENVGSFKELYDVHLKATQNIEINGTSFQTGETIALFDKIQIAGLNEVVKYVSACGGYGNRDHVYWETTKKLKLTFSQGVFSNTQFSILNNAKAFYKDEMNPILITKTEELEVDEFGHIQTTQKPIDQIFVYLKDTGEKINFESVGAILLTDSNYKFQDVVVRYRYAYANDASIVKIGQRCLTGFLELEGKTRVKDDTSGLITTGIIKIPKLKLMSGLSIRLGAQANPVVGVFEGEGVPVESRYNSYVVEFDFLSNDIDSDM